jgi:hypothetical protein
MTQAIWLGSPNFTPGRAGHDMTQPSWVVLHTMVGTVAGANARFQQASEQASATYGVGLDGRVYQWVRESDAAWANGATGRGGVGDNLDSISIEHEDDTDYDGPRTPELYAGSAALVRDICTRYAVPIDRTHVIGHRECDFAQTACPDGLDVDRIVREAAVPPAPTPAPGLAPKERIMPLTVTRKDGSHDVFTVLSNGRMRHLYVDTAGKPEFNDALPGTWAVLLDASWDAQETALTVRGWGLDEGLWMVRWTAAPLGWSTPARLV